MTTEPCKHCEKLQQEKSKILLELVEADDIIEHLAEELRLLEDELELLSREIPHKKK